MCPASDPPEGEIAHDVRLEELVDVVIPVAWTAFLAPGQPALSSQLVKLTNNLLP
jgi:hypothetical protein